MYLYFADIYSKTDNVICVFHIISNYLLELLPYNIGTYLVKVVGISFESEVW